MVEEFNRDLIGAALRAGPVPLGFIAVLGKFNNL